MRTSMLAVCIYAGIVGVTVAAQAEKPLLRVPVTTTTGLSGYDALEQRIPGAPLPGGAPLVDAEQGTSFMQIKALHTGKTDEGMVYGADGRIKTEAGTVSFWVIGDKWDVSAGGRDVFWRVNGAGGFAELVRDKAGTFALVGESAGKAYRVEAPLPKDMSIMRQIAVTYESGNARLFIDGQAVGAAGAFMMPAQPKDLILGQSGPGGGVENRRQRQFIVYGRAQAAGEIARAFYVEGLFALNRTAAIVKTTKKITIDGKINPEEWSEAAAITGLLEPGADYGASGFTAPEQTVFYVTYDDDNLYVAMICPTPDKVKNDPATTAGMGGFLKLTEGQHDASVDRDDAFEVNVVIPQLNGDLYRMVVNGFNTTYDYTTGGDAPGSVLKGIDINWEPKWQVVADNVSMEGGWQVEARIPFASFKAGKPAPGTAWGMNFKRLWAKFRTSRDAWNTGYRFGAERKFYAGAYAYGVPGLVTFQGREGAVVRLTGIGQPDSGFLKIAGDVVNTAGETRQVKLAVTSESGETATNRVLNVPAGGSAPFIFEARIKSFTENRVTFAAVDMKTGAEIHHLEIPVFLRQALTITAHPYPTAGLLKVQLDVSGLAEYPAGELSAAAILKKKGGGGALAKIEFKKLTSYQQDLLIPTRTLAEGDYDVDVTVRRGRKQLVAQTVPYTKRPMPEWYGNSIGYSDDVPAPFTKMKLRGDKILVWGREYQFDGALYPKQITILGRKLLRSPMKLVVTAPDGKDVADEGAKVETKWTKVSPTRIEGIRTAVLGDYTVENSFWMEYDGLLWSTLKVSSAAKKPLGGLRLEIPLTPDFTDVINPYDYSLRTTGKLPEQGYSSRYRPVWLGNAVGGLQWMAESDGDWNVKDGNREIVVRNDKGTATMIITFVDQPTDLSTPLPLPFGLIATPVKDTSAIDYRNGRTGWGYSWYPPNQEFIPAPSGWRVKNPDDDSTFMHYGAPAHRPKIFGNRTIHGSSGPYVTQGTIVPAAEDAADCAPFADEWSVSQGAKSYNDYFIWRYWKLYENNHFAALYYDGGQGVGAEPTAGIGYHKRDGSWGDSYQILGMRDLMKRFYTMVKLRHPDAVIKCHHSGLPNMAFISFCDYFVDGENTINMFTQDKPDYRGKLRPDTYRAEMMGHNFGFVTDFLYQFTRSGLWTYEGMKKAGPDIVDHVFGLTLLHDSTLWASYGPYEYWLRVERALHRHNWGPNYRMIPYWQQDIVKMPTNMFATFYRDDFIDKAICIFYNDGEFKGELRLKLDWKKLGFQDLARLSVQATGHELVTTTKENPNWSFCEYDFAKNPDDYARLEGEELVFPLTPYNYRMIVVEQKDK